MDKKINLVYEWIGPNGPITNIRVPTLVDFMHAGLRDLHISGYPHDAAQTPHFYIRFPNHRLVPTFNMPQDGFLYELNFSQYHYKNVLNIFNARDGFLENNKVSQDVIDRIKNKQGYFLITVLYESFVKDDFLFMMSRYFEEKNIPLTQIIYATNCANGVEIYKNFCARAGRQPEINMEYVPTFRIDKTNLEDVIAKYSQIEYVPGIRQKLFLCFNRRYSDHRLLFYTNVVKKGLLDKFYISMAKVQPESTSPFFSSLKYIAQKLPAFQITDDDVVNADGQLPLVLDSNDFNRYPMEPNGLSMESYYTNSLVHIISETFFFDNYIHITEKTYKPIAYMQPFIMMSAPGSLKHIKDMGFKTFDKYWDESYDLELDATARMLKIYNIVDQIAAWDEAKQFEFSHSIKDIVEFNVRHLNTIQNIEVENFTNKYGT